jgi:tetratricopeptide (TPR) repeat protein
VRIILSSPENAQISGPVNTGAATQSGGVAPSAARQRVDGAVLALGCALLAAAFAAYCRTFAVPFVFDDLPSIVDNPSIRHLGTAFLPPGDSTVGGRPVLNASLAINYAVSGLDVWSYHAVNLAIHGLAGLALFGILRRTLPLRLGRSATMVAFCAALIWVLHPLLTESVTYVIQRGESLMGLFFLLTLYCLIRGAESATGAAKAWYVLCVSSCLLGMGTKEVMVSAPIIALLFDRTFLSGSFMEAWRRRRWVYAGLAVTWLLLPFLVFSTHDRNGSAGFGHGVTPVSYALTQFPAVVHYLRLSFWPYPLVFDYGSALAPASPWAGACILFVAALVAATLWALARRPSLGFLGAAFFAILAPSSSVVPVVTETMAEHRMYLPLAAVVVLVVVSLHSWMRRGALPLCLLIAAALFWVTWQRNGVYRSEKGLWEATVDALPSNERAQNNLGNMLALIPGRLDEAVDHFREALRLEPGYADAHYNLGVSLYKIPGRANDAISEYEAALRLEPGRVEAHNNLGNALMSQGRTREAMVEFQEALRLDPAHAEAHYNMGNALSSLGRQQEAIAQYREALRTKPDHVEAHFNLGNALVAVGKPADAVGEYENAIRLRPGYADARYNLANALDSVGRTPEAIEQFGATLRLKPDFVEAHNYLGFDLEKNPDRLDEAVQHLQAALRLRPDYVDAHYNLGVALMAKGHVDAALSEFKEVIRLDPDNRAAAQMLQRNGQAPR